MKKMTKLALALAAAAFCGAAQASVIQVEGANGTSPFLGSGAAYAAAVDAALLGPSYHSAMVTSLDWISHSSLFGSNSNFAMKTTIDFTLDIAAKYYFRAGVDFGMGGAMLLDGVALDFKGSDMWYNYSYDNPSQFLAASKTLSAGNHVLTILGFEGCCDGGQQVQFKTGDTSVYTSFANDDGLSPVADIPEPASISLALAGLGLLGLSRRRKAAARQA